MKAMILAAGLGTRLRPYSRHTPKALFTINERPVLAIAIEKLQKAGSSAVIINTHHHHRQIESFVANSTFSIPIYTRHEKKILGTGGGIRNVADFWEKESLLVINADIVSNIDLARVCEYHQNHAHPVTMVMHDHARFNSVSVDAEDFITGFGPRRQNPQHRTLAFTGIHVLDRCVLNYLPPQGPAHIIDAYTKMIEAGERIKAQVIRGHRWYDIGTPENYQSAVYDHMAPEAFIKAFGHRPAGALQKVPLKGDGSDRRWSRIHDTENSLIVVEHGIRSSTGVQEVDAYVSIGRHLAAHRVAVPKIHAHDRHAGLVFNQDLGDTHLQTFIGKMDANESCKHYQAVIDQWIVMAVEAGRSFDTVWTYQTPYYDAQVVLDNECRYFTQAFVEGYLGWPPAYEELRQEFEQLAEKIMQAGIAGFVHRDFQSRNIMIQGEKPYFIDFQGGRLGPIQYDLASLLIDPYTDLPGPVQSQLLVYAVEKLRNCIEFNRDQFLKGYGFCAVSRNLQILGAFAFLSRIKGKPHFETYIPIAARSLQRNLACLKGLSLPKLEKIAEKIVHEINNK
ncbi:MAG: sugar phosphate nucleotidyltransferase [Desulfobacteraceae bacterium]|jgi:aminoglycoside/choline kinase family phosphotransferase/dTDP-glucose pyrophosphorylase